MANYQLDKTGAYVQNLISQFASSKGTNAIPIYVNGGSNTTPGALTQITAANMFSAFGITNGTTGGPILNITIAGQNRTVAIPSASTTVSGVVNTGSQSFTGNKELILKGNDGFSIYYPFDGTNKTIVDIYNDTAGTKFFIGAIDSNQTSKGSMGYIRLTGPGGNGWVFISTLTTYQGKDVIFPNYNGNMYLTHTSGTSAVGTSTKPVYVAANGRITEGSSYGGGTAVTLNGTSKAASTASFYAPTASGTANQVLISGGTNTSPTWTNQSNLSVGSAKKMTVDGTAGQYWGMANNSAQAWLTTTVSNTWTAGTTSGPTLKTTVNGTAGTAVAIPSAGTGASGVVTTTTQGFLGEKSFYSPISVYSFVPGGSFATGSLAYGVSGQISLYVRDATTLSNNALVGRIWGEISNSSNITGMTSASYGAAMVSIGIRKEVQTPSSSICIAPVRIFIDNMNSSYAGVRVNGYIGAQNKACSWVDAIMNYDSIRAALDIDTFPAYNSGSWYPWVRQRTGGMEWAIGVFPNNNTFDVVGNWYSSDTTNRVETHFEFRQYGRLFCTNAKNTESQSGVIASSGTIYMYSQGGSGNKGLYCTNGAIVTVNASGTITHHTSDRRFKTSRGFLDDQETYNILSELPIVNFVYTEDLNKNNLEQSGIYAQELRDILLKYNYKNRNYLQVFQKEQQTEKEKENSSNEIDKPEQIIIKNGVENKIEATLLPIEKEEPSESETPQFSYDLTIPEEQVKLYSMNYEAMIPLLIKGWQMHEHRIQELENLLK